VGQGFIHGAQVLLHDLVALFTVRVADRFTNGLNGLVTRSTLEIAKKHACRMVFMREPMPVSRAT